MTKVLQDILHKIFKIESSKARVLYARSKMSIPNESLHSNSYKHLKYVEFLELICRTAHKIFKMVDTAKHITFLEQLEMVLD